MMNKVAFFESKRIKTAGVVLAGLLLAVLSIGSAFAWLTTSSGVLQNDFTFADLQPKKYAIVSRGLTSNQVVITFDEFDEDPKAGDLYIVDEEEHSITACYYAGDSSTSGWEVSTTQNNPWRSTGTGAYASRVDVKVDLHPKNMISWFRQMPYLATINGLEHIDTSSVSDMSYLFNNCPKLESVDGIAGWDVSNVVSFREAFSSCGLLPSLDINGWNTCSAQNMQSMFYGCSGLTSLDLVSWDVSSVQNMSSMFCRCYGLKELNLSTWDVSNVDNMSCMFAGYANYSNLVSLDISGWEANLTQADQMFSELRKLSSLSASFENWQFKQNANMNKMFYCCYSLKELDLKGWNIPSNSNFSMLLDACQGLEDLNVEGWIIGEKAELSNIFEQLDALTVLDLSTWKMPSSAGMSSLFSNCSKLETIYVSPDTNWSSINNSGYNIFNRCFSLIGGQGSSFDATNDSYARVDGLDGQQGYFTPKITVSYYDPDTDSFTAPFLFKYGVVAIDAPEGYKGWAYDISSANSIYYSGEDVTYQSSNINNFALYPCKVAKLGRFAIVTKNIDDLSKYTLSFDLIEDDKVAGDDYIIDGSACEIAALYPAGTGDVAGWEISRLTDKNNQYWSDYASSIDNIRTNIVIRPLSCAYWFHTFTSIKTIDFSKWDFSACTSMEWMFFLSSVETIDLSNIIMPGVTSMQGMFHNCEQLVFLDASNWNPYNCKSMAEMFNQCLKLEEIRGLETWNVSTVTDMKYMLGGRFKTLDLSRWNVSRVTNMEGLFNNCLALETLNITGWSVNNVQNMKVMFAHCPVKTIYCDTSNIWMLKGNSTDMFYGALNLIGGQGTKVLSDYTATKAVVDGYQGNAGYFTPKITVSYYDPDTDAAIHTHLFEYGDAAEDLDQDGFLGWAYEQDSAEAVFMPGDLITYQSSNIKNFILYPVFEASTASLTSEITAEISKEIEEASVAQRQITAEVPLCSDSASELITYDSSENRANPANTSLENRTQSQAESIPESENSEPLENEMQSSVQVE